MSGKRLHIFIAGGGTGGHLFPGIAIADEIKKQKPDVEITFVGTKGKIEERVVPLRGYNLATIWISGLKRRFALETFFFPVKVVVSLMQSFFLLRKVRPDVVVGTGGYVCGPVVFAATIMGIPTLLQEQNSYPGLTTRLLCSRVNEVHLTFERSRAFLRRTDNVKVTGNPTRAAVGSVSRAEGARQFSLNPEKRILLVFGGSLGAHSVNMSIAKILPSLHAMDVQIIWQTGPADFEEMQARAASRPAGMSRVLRFIDSMEHAYGACDVAVTRAGATTVAELSRAGVPSILVPYPLAAADHQTENARAMVEAGASVMIKDDELDVRLLRVIQQLMSDQKRLTLMSERALSLGQPEAAKRLAEAVFEYANTGYVRTKDLQIQT